MAATPHLLGNPRMTAAIAELTELIRGRYPGTTFTTDISGNEEAVFVTAVVDVDDPDEVVDCFIDRVVTLQVEERLPIHVIPIRTPARNEKLLATMQSPVRPGGLPRSAAG